MRSERSANARQAIYVQRPSRVQIPVMSFGGSTASETAEHNFSFHRVYMMDGKEPAMQLFEEMLRPAISKRFLKGVNTTVPLSAVGLGSQGFRVWALTGPRDYFFWA